MASRELLSTPARGGRCDREYFGLERTNLLLPWIVIRSGSDERRTANDHLLHPVHARSPPNRRLRELRQTMAANHRAMRRQAHRLFPPKGGRDQLRTGPDRLRIARRLRAVQKTARGRPRRQAEPGRRQTIALYSCRESILPAPRLKTP